MMRVVGVCTEGGIGAGGEVFCLMQFPASIDHGGRRGPYGRHDALLLAFDHTTINKYTRQQVSNIKT
jgi:hypothetical protein